jgi:hypothetical protein
LIESNAMKRLITLITSAVLLCPMWAGAQSTATIPKIIGPLTFTFSGTVGMTCSPGYALFTDAFKYNGSEYYYNNIARLDVNVTSPSNSLGAFSLSGMAYSYYQNGSCNSGPYPIPASGTMISVDSTGYAATSSPASYLLYVQFGPVSFTCTLDAASLGGPCIDNTQKNKATATFSHMYWHAPANPYNEPN